MKSPPRPPHGWPTIKEVEERRLFLYSIPEYRKAILQRNIAWGFLVAMAAWSIFCLYLVGKFMERAL